jgi:hypothetical protein
MPKKLYQIQIALRGIKPKIWRRLIVEPEIRLDDFHRILQTAMGWTNSHLHLFRSGNFEYSPIEFEVEDTINSRRIKLSSILNMKVTQIRYLYDFGDFWEHDIILEEIIKEEIPGNVPRCLKGKRNCPPEDCGGIWGYEDLLKIISNPKHDEYESTLEWLAGHDDPEYFNLLQVNNSLMQKDYGCEWIE